MERGLCRGIVIYNAVFAAELLKIGTADSAAVDQRVELKDLGELLEGEPLHRSDLFQESLFRLEHVFVVSDHDKDSFLYNRRLPDIVRAGVRPDRGPPGRAARLSPFDSCYYTQICGTVKRFAQISHF